MQSDIPLNWFLYFAAASFAIGLVGVLLRRNAIAVLMAAWMAVAGNTKDLGDVAGDRAAGRRTLPVSLGIRRAAWATAIACCVVGVAGLFIPSVVARVVAACLLAAALVMIGLAAYGRSLETKRMYAVFMVSQVVSNLVIVVVA